VVLHRLGAVLTMSSWAFLDLGGVKLAPGDPFGRHPPHLRCGVNVRAIWRRRHGRPGVPIDHHRRRDAGLTLGRPRSGIR